MLKLLGFLLLASLPSCASELILGDFKTDLIPRPLPYAVLLPNGYKDGPSLPMLMYLHGGNSSRDELVKQRDFFDDEWKSGRLPKMVVATITGGPFCMYIDYRDGSEKWESLIIGPFRTFVQKTYNASSDPKKNLLFGGSMGGFGTLNIGLKHPELYAGIGALMPGLTSALYWKDRTPQDLFFIADEQWHTLFGNPVDGSHWEANNPNLTVTLHSKRIRDSGLQVYLDVGDDDSLHLFVAVEHFHRLLWDASVKHEYHVVHGGDHGGRTMRARTAEALEFLGRVIDPPGPDPEMQKFREMIAPAKQKLGITDDLK